MPPKRATRRAGGTPQRPSSITETGYQSILEQSRNQPDLPSIPIGASWNYGAATTTAVPQRMTIRPTMNIDQMAETVEARLEIARERTAAAKKRQPQARQSKREPTPDQTQLQQSLYNATTDQHSDKTPTPPIPHAVSTDSSPEAEPPLQRRLSNSPLYPSPLQRPGGSRHGSIGSWSSRHSSVDNASEASWNLERDINEDDLQRTRPSKYRGEKHGHNISAPPRRVSGLANVPEEDESSIKSEPEPGAWNPVAQTPPPDFPPGPPRQSFLRRWLASMKPRRSIVDKSTVPSDDPTPARRGSLLPILLEKAHSGPYSSLYLAAIWLFLILGSMSCCLVALKVHQTLYPPEWDWDSPTVNMSHPEVFHGLRNQISKMDVKMSSLSSELSSVVSEQSLSNVHDSTPTDVAVHRRPIHKVNFLSVGLGALVDPSNTSPTLGSKLGVPARAFLWFAPTAAKNIVRASQPPVSALTPWEEVGDCWCSPTRNGTTQLSVLLGRDIVAEELQVEHIPVGASLEPEAAPRTIELWARFKVNPHKTPVKAKRTPEATPRRGLFSVFGDATVSLEPPATQAPSSRETGLGGFLIPGIGSLHELIMDLLRRSNPSEPETAYSDDPILGENFYRIGKMEYNIHSPDNVQAFKLNTIVDVSTIRVDKVVFRVTSNWGASHTCIYRFKLHGHI
ncbi:uncharacterized protein N7529_004473 [Penicillium soppii]|uniref:uncharacterized protein n=1 Tax=Penicillium soppii TaxID=69789 RepID=UPI0025497BE3|nr:uncharacterized protein N7529_004473 [Penicillium soppii]KAJ5872120.1 hypothetical protein N7529_004473 [Penicillium soppii]